MKFGRVLVTTALVAVLASSLFSGWVGSSLSPLKIPAALAADYNSTCSNQSSQITVSADFSLVTSTSLSDPTSKTVKTSVSVSGNGLAAISGNITAVKATLYRAATSNQNYGAVETRNLTNSSETWRGEFTNTLPTGTYRYFVQATATVFSAQEKKCSSQSIDFINGATPPPTPTTINTAPAKAVDYDTLKKWFSYGGIDKGGRVIKIVVTEDEHAPYIDVYAEGERPRLRFRLTQLVGVGKGLGLDPQTANKDYYIFSANEVTSGGSSETETPIQNLYVISYDVTNRGVIMTPQDGKGFGDILTDLEADIWLKIPWGDPTFLGGLDPISIGDSAWEFQSFGINEESWLNLQRYIYIDPNTGGNRNCRDNDVSTTKIVPGPKPNAKQKLDPSGDKWGALNANCLNRDPTGWPVKSWGVTVSGSAFEAVDAWSGCSLNGLVALKEGIGSMIVKMIGCVIGYIAEDVIKRLEIWFVDLGELSLAPSNDGSERSPPSFRDRSLLALVVGTAHAESTVQDLGYEEELNEPGGVIVKVWKIALSLLNIFVVIALLAIAFANILHLNISTYAAKKALPGIILGVIGASASLIIMRFLADVGQALAYLAVDISGASSIPGMFTGMLFAMGKATWIGLAATLAVGAGIGAVTGGVGFVATLILVVVIILYYIFLLIAFMFTLLKRLVILYMLSMVAPLAFAAYGLPQTQSYFFKWWNLYLTYLFLFPIILLGMAMTMLLSQNLQLSQLQPFTVPGIVGIALVLGAASLTLKLPKMMTKGALDVGAMFKKAIGAAPRIAQGAQGLHSFAYGGGKERLAAKMTAMRAKGPAFLRYGKSADELRQASKGWSNKARDRRKDIKLKGTKANKWAGRFKDYLGATTLFGDPELFQKAYQERAERDKKMGNIAALTRVGRLPGKLRGPAEAELQRKLGLEEYGNAQQISDIRAIDDTLGSSHLKEVYDKEDADKNLWIQMLKATGATVTGDKENGWEVTGGNRTKAMKLLKKFRNRANEDDMLDFIEGDYKDDDPEGGGIGIANVWAMEDLMKVSARESTVGKLARQARLLETEGITTEMLKDMTADQIEELKFHQVDPPNTRDVKPRSGGGGATPSGGPNRPPDDNPPKPPGGGGSPSGGPGNGKVQKVFVTNPVTIQNPQSEALANQLAASAERIMGKFSLEELNNHATNAQDMGELLSGEIGEAIKGEFGSFMNAGGGDLIRHAISAYASGGGLDAIRQKVATGEVIQQTNQNLSGQAAGFSDDQLDRLAQSISAGNSDALREIGGLLAPHIDQLSKAAGVIADPNLQTKYAQRIIDGFRQVMTQGPKSMRSYLQTNFSEFANAFSQENNIDHITPESIAKAIAKSQGDDKPPKPPDSGGGALPPPAPPTPPAN